MTSLETDPEIQMFIQILQIGIQIQQGRVSVFTGARGEELERGGWLLKWPQPLVAGQKTHFSLQRTTKLPSEKTASVFYSVGFYF